jgi:hypothetical protein
MKLKNINERSSNRKLKMIITESQMRKLAKHVILEEEVKRLSPTHLVKVIK